MAAQSSDGRLRRGRRSLGYRPCLVRMAVGVRAHLGSRRWVSFWSLLRGRRGADGVGFVPTFFGAFDATGEANREAHRCSMRLLM